MVAGVHEARDKEEKEGELRDMLEYYRNWKSSLAFNIIGDIILHNEGSKKNGLHKSSR